MDYHYPPINIDKAFINYPINASFSEALQCDVTVVNDADAAGLVEMTHGKGKGLMDWSSSLH